MKKPRWYRRHNNLFDLNEVAAVTEIVKNVMFYEFEVVLRGGFAIRIRYSEDRSSACEACHTEIMNRLLETHE